MYIKHVHLRRVAANLLLVNMHKHASKCILYPAAVIDLRCYKYVMYLQLINLYIYIILSLYKCCNKGTLIEE